MFNIKSVVYPEKIVARLTHLSNIRPAFDSNAIGTAANFSCGSFVRFLLSIDGESHIVVNAVLESNGCGYMLAAADVLTESVINKRLIDLHGLADSDLNEQVCKSLGEIPSGASRKTVASSSRPKGKSIITASRR